MNENAIKQVKHLTDFLGTSKEQQIVIEMLCTIIFKEGVMEGIDKTAEAIRSDLKKI